VLTEDASSKPISGGDNSLAVTWCGCPEPPPCDMLGVVSVSSSPPVYQRIADDDGLFDLDKRGSVRTFFLLSVNNIKHNIIITDTAAISNINW